MTLEQVRDGEPEQQAPPTESRRSGRKRKLAEADEFQVFCTISL